MKWVEIAIVTTEEAADLAANIMIEEGCGGAAITGAGVRAADSPDVVLPDPAPEQTTLTGYIPADEEMEGRLDAITARFRGLAETGIDIGKGEISVKPVEEKDWASAWRSFFKPVRIGKVLVCPSWEKPEAEPDDVVLRIDPGMAFGTGNHPTTKLCLEAIQKYIRKGDRVLDAGTGSGILAIAAAKLGASHVTATEIEKLAVEAAARNFRRNRVAHKITLYHADSPLGLASDIDLAAANITADPIIKMREAFRDSVTRGGLLIISGVVTDRAEEVTNKIVEVGFTRVETSIDDDWAAVVFRREG
mgnify:CR=1 FL=1